MGLSKASLGQTIRVSRFRNSSVLSPRKYFVKTWLLPLSLSLFFFILFFFVFKFYLRINYIHPRMFKNLSSRVYEMRTKLVKNLKKNFFASMNSTACKTLFKQKYGAKKLIIMIIHDHIVIKRYVVLYDRLRF